MGMIAGTGRHDLAVLESAGYGMRQMLEIEETQRGSEVGGGVDRWRRRSARQNPSRWSRPLIPPSGEGRYRVFKRLYPALTGLFSDPWDGARDRAIDSWVEQGSMKASTSKTGSATVTLSV